MAKAEINVCLPSLTSDSIPLHLGLELAMRLKGIIVQNRTKKTLLQMRQDFFKLKPANTSEPTSCPSFSDLVSHFPFPSSHFCIMNKHCYKHKRNK